ncbi:MAG TPA: histidine phosphatase family protein [Acetobacteraceae bacterium]
MSKLTLRYVAIAIAVFLGSVGEEGLASAQPTTSASDGWKPPQRRRIVLMRHGDVSYFDAQGQPVSDSDKVSLNDKGRAEADATGTYLKSIGFVKFDRVISSTLPRTVETAERVMGVLGQAGEPTEVEALREIRIGSSQEIRDLPTSELPQSILGMMQPRVSGEQRLLRGESVEALQRRVFPALDALLDDKGWQTALWVLHGGVNQAILSHALTGDASYYGRFDLGPGCFSIMDVGANFHDAVIKAVNVCPDPLPYAPRLDTLEMLLEANLKARAVKP